MFEVLHWQAIAWSKDTQICWDKTEWRLFQKNMEVKIIGWTEKLFEKVIYCITRPKWVHHWSFLCSLPIAEVMIDHRIEFWFALISITLVYINSYQWIRVLIFMTGCYGHKMLITANINMHWTLGTHDTEGILLIHWGRVLSYSEIDLGQYCHWVRMISWAVKDAHCSIVIAVCAVGYNN